MGNLQEELKHFTGSMINTTHPLNRKIAYTEGVRYLAEKAQAYWLLDDIVIYQSDPAINGLGFQAWMLSVHDEGGATLRVEDGDKKHIKSIDIKFTDFPLKKITLWLIGNTLLLPSEY